MSVENSIAKILLEAGAVTLRPDEPFRYTSGMLSPIYTDNRVLISFPNHRKAIAKALAATLEEHYSAIDAFAGTATAGIAWAAWLCEKYDIPMVYIRDRAKRHGQQNQIEGILTPGARTIVVEDLVTTGGSALGSVHAVRKAGAEPLAVISIFTYETETAVTAFKKSRIPLHALTNFSTLVDTAERQGLITPASHAKVLQWAEDPAGWGAKMGFE